jgi:hypothetical protein
MPNVCNMNPRDVLRWSQRRWPLWLARRTRHMVAVTLASCSWYLHMSLYGAATTAERLAKYLVVAAERGMTRAHHTLHPFDHWGGPENLARQREYDRLAVDYASATVEARNAMVPAAPTPYPWPPTTLLEDLDQAPDGITIGSCKGDARVN